MGSARTLGLAAVAGVIALSAASVGAVAADADGARLCDNRAACSFVVGYPAGRLLFSEAGAARHIAKNGRICNDGWQDRRTAASGGKAELSTQSAAGVWSDHWISVAPDQCRSFHGALNVRLRAASPQSAWRAIFFQSDD